MHIPDYSQPRVDLKFIWDLLKGGHKIWQQTNDPESMVYVVAWEELPPAGHVVYRFLGASHNYSATIAAFLQGFSPVIRKQPK